MSFFKSLLLIVISSFFILWINAQLSKFKNLSNDDFAKLCAKNNVNLTKSNDIRKLGKLLVAYIEPNENPEKMQNCMNSTLREELEYNMNNIVKKCIQGSIELDESEIQQLIDESEKRYCGLHRIACYDWYLEDTIGCLNYTIYGNCEDEMFEKKLENVDEFANLGLSFTPKGLKNFIQILDCKATNAEQNCNEQQTARRKQLQNEFIDTFAVIRK
ncbi:uncharacterized protein LOC122508392 [Leptopilina heterotoma]|uniref:uncharacterized protein LOC122508392 n=1 Tax=Leptopilina heterotoma TaxID=63436 RepID=UPI001CA9F857|nr:uncharacterized protein LOC122508392 [Leptopilina heterotoma]